jgi:hypothetical protein
MEQRIQQKNTQTLYDNTIKGLETEKKLKELISMKLPFGVISGKNLKGSPKNVINSMASLQPGVSTSVINQSEDETAVSKSKFNSKQTSV